MYVIVGLGNPGAQYATTRHNVGFWFVDTLHQQYNGQPWRKKFQAEVADIVIEGHKVMMVKPQTFMNLSGQSVIQVLNFYKVAPEKMLVVYDDLDLPTGDIRFKKIGGSGGHNGIKSLLAHVPATFGCLKIGIGHPGHRGQVSSYVLSPFTAPEADHVAESLGTSAQYIGLLLEGKPSLFMEKVRTSMGQ